MILDINDQGAKTSSVDIAGFSKLAVFMKPDVGGHKSCMLRLQISPDGSTWHNVLVFNPKKYQTFDVLGHSARLRVETVQGEAASVDIVFMTGN